MAGIKGMKKKRKHEDSQMFPEYYQKQNPEWSKEQCEEKAKWFRRSCNYQCIEYYERNYPELSHDEHLKLKQQLQDQKKQNNPLNIEYYINKYPELSREEQEILWCKYKKESCYQSEEYYIKRGATIEEAKKLKEEKLKIVTPKIVAKISGQNNGMSSTNRTEQQRKESSPFSKEFYIKRGLSENDRKKFNEQVSKNRSYNTQLEYYLNKGMSEQEAKKALQDRQTTFTLEKCIKKYGEIKGKEIFVERQTHWKKSLQKAFNHSNSPYTQSAISNKMIDELCNYMHIQKPKDELCLINENTIKIKSHYFYDFNYKNKIIEFNGDYWHCNPKYWSPDKINKSFNQTAQSIWEKDLNKKQCAEYHGYKVLIVWESDYKENKEETLQKCIDFLTND